MKSLSAQKINQLQRMLATAQQARQSGMIQQAESLYRDVLKQAPEAWDVRQQLAMLLATTGRADEAARQFRLITQANPTHAASHANLATALSESNQLDDAIKEFQRALALNPGLLGAKIALAETLRRAKRTTESVNLFKAVLDQDKANHAAFNGLGLAYGDMEDFPRALECFEHAVGLAPKEHEYRMNFGVTLRRSKLISFAVEQLHEAVMLQPKWLEAIVLLGEVLQEQLRYDEAKECFERAKQLKHDEPELDERIGYVFLGMGDSDRALQQFSQVICKHPTRYKARWGLSRAHMLAGHSEDASLILEELIREFPEHAGAYASLATSRKFSSSDNPLIEQLQKLAEGTPDNVSSAIPLSFALGKIFDDCKDWDNAWKYYERGNRLRNQSYQYRPEKQEAKYDSLMSVFTRNFIKEHQHLGIQDSLPIFIVGMPRSGTTLTEQIISSHPQVIGAGEVVFWGREETLPASLEKSLPYPECISLMTPEHAKDITNRYITLLQKISGRDTRPTHITDKMPHNFTQLGLIALLFPNAVIIHCKRNAMDNCLSIFFQDFEGEHPYAYDLANMGHHYREYERLMAHWHAVLPGRIIDINYEETIADSEYWSRTLIKHVGLEWDDACLAPHKLERTVKTASHWQVRQPIYKTSVQRWKNYEAHLGPLKDALGYTG